MTGIGIIGCGIPERRMSILGTEGAIRTDVMTGANTAVELGAWPVIHNRVERETHATDEVKAVLDAAVKATYK